LTQNLAHDLSVTVVQIEQSLVKYLASISSASNTFKQQTRVHIVTMVMLKYVKQEAQPSYKSSNLSQQNIKAAQKLDTDAISQQQTNLSGVGQLMDTELLQLLFKGVTCKDRNTYV